jgi:hypothetical protein
MTEEMQIKSAFTYCDTEWGDLQIGEKEEIEEIGRFHIATGEAYRTPVAF